MKQWIVLMLVLASVVWVAGCGPTTIKVDPNNDAEAQAVSQYLAARVDYLHWLRVVDAFYRDEDKNLDKQRWVRLELANLNKSAAKANFDYDLKFNPPGGQSLINRDERVLVENLVKERKRYLDRESQLAEFYRNSGQAEKLAGLNKVRDAFNPVHTYMYFLDAEIPGPDLRPSVVYSETEDLYEEAMAYKSLLARDKDKIAALQKLLKIVHGYPDSTKIALAAYHIGELYNHFDEHIRAVRWYERAWQWDPKVDEPARYRAAVVYDMDLHNVKKAIEMYNLSRKYDPQRLLNDDVARVRAAELSQPEK